ncbi:hypothetical protein ABLO27_19825, partial [Roseibium sp. SCPC15]|uniref:hypothetical protein n=1 Tax=Roseibium sp. SCP15 TaxID=3141376 RepID=UPI0033383FAA
SILTRRGPRNEDNVRRNGAQNKKIMHKQQNKKSPHGENQRAFLASPKETVPKLKGPHQRAQSPTKMGKIRKAKHRKPNITTRPQTPGC